MGTWGLFLELSQQCDKVTVRQQIDQKEPRKNVTFPWIIEEE